MKKNILFSFIFLSVFFISPAQQPWQKLSDRTTTVIVSNFNTPPPEYGMILWWGWDGPMTDTVIKRDLEKIKTMGFTGVMIEAGYGMKAKYLSKEWFELVRIAVEEARIKGMRVWIEDEGKYPSGFAGGKFSNERPDLKMQGLVLTEKIDAVSGDSIVKQLPYYVVSAAAYNENERTTKIIDITSGQLNWKVPAGAWKIYLAGHRFRSSVTRSVNNPSRGKDTTASLFDYLNPLATRQFLEWTHEEYKKYIGKEFGKTFMGFMGDEPDFAYTPWTPRMLEEFRQRKSYDAKPFLASFFVPYPDEETKRVKADYWDVWSDLFRDNFFKVQSDWCNENNIEYIVHLNHEDQVTGLVKSSGDFFKNMRYVGVPGVDAIWSQIWMDHVADYPKLASSAAHVYGRPRAFTESFAAYTHRPTVPQAKWVLDYQLVRGINSVQIMFMPASANRRLSGRTPVTGSGVIPSQTIQRSGFFMSDTFPPVAKYINRATYLLSQGQPAAQICVYFPTTSMWYGDNGSNSSVLEISRQLMENQRDFDFVDEQAFTANLVLENGKFKNSSGGYYSAIIIPSVSVVSKTTLLLLSKFAAEGGKVIFMGNLPSLVTDKNFLKSSNPGDLSWAVHEISGKLTASVLDALPHPDLSTDRHLPQIKYLHRIWKDGDLYFIFNESQEPVTFNVTLSGKGKADLWDATTGKIIPLKSTITKGRVTASLIFGGWESKFIMINR